MARMARGARRRGFVGRRKRGGMVLFLMGCGWVESDGRVLALGGIFQPYGWKGF